MADSNQGGPLLNFWGKRATSFVWRYFGFNADEDGKYKDHNSAICRVCSHPVRYIGNTTNLAHHLRHHGIGAPNTNNSPKVEAEYEVLPTPLVLPSEGSLQEPPAKLPRPDVTMVEHWSKSKRSVVWDYFGFYATVDGQYIDKSETVCRLCQTSMRYNGNTTNLANHLSRYHGIDGILTSHDPELVQGTSNDCLERVNQILHAAAAEVQQRERSLSSSPGGDNSSGTPNPNLLGIATIYNGTPDHVTTTTSEVGFKRKMPSSFGSDRMNISSERLATITNGLSQYFIGELLPASHVKSPSLHYLIHAMEPMYRMPSPEYFKTTILQRCLEDTKTRLEIDGFWQAPQHTVIVHRWPLLTSVHKCEPPRHCATLIASYITEDFKLKSNIIQTVPDGISDADLENVLQSWHLKFPVIIRSSPKTQTGFSTSVLLCFEATVNTAIVSCLQQNGLGDIITQCLSSLLKESSENQRVSQICSLSVLSDLSKGCIYPNQWTIVLNLLSLYVEDPCLQRPNEEHPEELDIITAVVKILQSFQTALAMLMSSRNGGASLILPTIFKLVNRQLTGTNTDGAILTKMKLKLKEMLNSAYENTEAEQLLHTVTVIDPRLKSLDWMDKDGKEAAYKSLHREAVHSLTTFERLLNIKQEPEETSGKCSSLRGRSEEIGDDLSFLADVLSGPAETSSKMTPDEQIREEIQRYRSEQDAKGGTCALSWWGVRTDTYPVLSHVARRTLCVPATCCPPFPVRYVGAVAAETPFDEISLAMFLHHNSTLE